MDIIMARLGNSGYFDSTYLFFKKLKRNHVEFSDLGDLYQLRVSGNEYLVRKYTSDEQVFVDVIIDGEYDVAIDFAKKNLSHIRKIVDAGANCGFTALHFGHHFPHAQIIALEPDPENYNVLIKNVEKSKLANIVPVAGGLTPVDGWLKADSGIDGREWGKTFKLGQHATDDGIRGYAIKTLMQKQGWDNVDILKMDIEGGEFDLFGDESFLEVIRNVKLLAMEIHDPGLKKQQICSTLAMAGFWVFDHIHLTIAIKKGVFIDLIGNG